MMNGLYGMVVVLIMNQKGTEPSSLMGARSMRRERRRAVPQRDFARGADKEIIRIDLASCFSQTTGHKRTELKKS